MPPGSAISLSLDARSDRHPPLRSAATTTTSRQRLRPTFTPLLPAFAASRAHALGQQSTPGKQSQLSRDSDCLYACGFRIYFTPLPGFFSPFPHGTGSLSVDHEYLALEDGPPIFGQDFTCPALLVVCLVPSMCFRVRGYHPLRQAFPDFSSNTSTITYRLLRFRSPLLTQSRLISFPPAT